MNYNKDLYKFTPASSAVEYHCPSCGSSSYTSIEELLPSRIGCGQYQEVLKCDSCGKQYIQLYEFQGVLEEI